MRVPYQDCFHLIEPLLAKVEKPSRYIDHEWGTLSKADADYRCCMIYPDVYEVGLPNQGIAILYNILNQAEGISSERGYEVAGVLAGGLMIRAVTRVLVKQTPHIGFVVKALTAAAGTYGMGRALVSLYERDVDYSRANEVVAATFSRVRDLVTTVAGATHPMASYQDVSDLAA